MFIPLQIAIVVPGIPFDGDTIKNKSLGGSESAGYYMARALAKLGHKVFMFCNCDGPGEWDGVIYNPIDTYNKFGPLVPHDVTIIQRLPELYAKNTNSKLNVLWCHDMASIRQADMFKAATWNIDQVAVLSQYMYDQYKDVYGVPESLLWKTRNGIDLELIESARTHNGTDACHANVGDDVPFPGTAIERDPKKLMYFARPERGLDVLLKKIFPKLLEKDPELTLYVAGYDNQADHLRPFYDECNQLMRSYGDRCVFLGYLTKYELYQHLWSTSVYVYPTPSPSMPAFNEISCIAAMECQAAGVPIVTSSRGALPETINENAGYVMTLDPEDPDYPDHFTEFVEILIEHEKTRQQMSEQGIEHAKTLSWDALAQEWTDHFIDQIYRRNDNPRRLLEHFFKTSDIIAAEALMETEPQLKHTPTGKRILKDWAFKNNPDTFRKQYEKIGLTHTDIFESVANEPRLSMMAEWLQKHPEVRSIVDWGCAMGAYAIHLSNVFPDLIIVGVDVDIHSIKLAKKYQQTKAVHPENLQFKTVAEMRVLMDSGEAIQKADGVFALEVLEHVPDPYAFIEELETLVKPGGAMAVNVPYGPWEYMSYDTYPHRCHMWEFDFHDLNDIFGNKPGYGLSAIPNSFDNRLGLPVGWHFLNYKVDHEPVGQIDMDRKLRLQRPGQTVSGVIIAGPDSEDTLRWSLRSYADRMDELIIADCGMSKAALKIATEYGANVVQAPKPLEAGFETPRNTALSHAVMDWVFWIDTDEKLLGGHNMTRYLRDNMWNGYGVRQHHFAIDTQFAPDMPVRLFRRQSSAGKCRWYGMIHEHPELALNEGPGLIVVVADLNIAHVGYLEESGRQERFWRNKPMLDADREKYPERVLQKHFIARDNMLLAGYLLSANGNRITPEITALCEETIEIYRDYFIGRPAQVNVDTIQYYSEALRVLDIGVDVAFDIVAGKGSVNGQLDGGVKRFANEDDLVTEITGRAKDAIKPYLHEHY